MFAPKGAHRVRSTPDPYPDIQMDSQTSSAGSRAPRAGRQSCSPSTTRWPRRSMDAGAWWRSRARPGIGKSSLVNACIERAREREMYTIAVRATELERSYPYGLVRQTADSVALDRSPRGARGALHRRRPARAADPGSRQRGGHRQPRADVPAPARPLLAHGQPGTRASAPDHDRRRPVGRRGVDGRRALPQPADRRPADGAAPGRAHRRGRTARRAARRDPCRPRDGLDPAGPALAGGRRSARGGAARQQRGPGVRRGAAITPPAATRSCSSSS